MGQRGPLPAPDNLRLLRGKEPSKAPPTVSKRLPPGRPSPPSWLDREAKAEWNRVVPALDELGVLAKVDRAIVATYCTAWSFERQAKAKLDEEGLTRVGGLTHPPAKNPAWQIWREAAAMVTTVGAQLLLTPTSRLRATMPEAANADEGEGILD